KMAFELRDLPTVEVARRLEPFVAESERLGFVFLSLTQREMLKQILVAEQGMNSLAEEEISQILGLSKMQREQVAKLMSQRRGDLADAGGSQQRITRALYERRLSGVMTEDQRVAWEKIAGVAAPQPQRVAEVTTPTVAQNSENDDGQDETQAKETQADEGKQEDPDRDPMETASDSPSDREGDVTVPRSTGRAVIGRGKSDSTEKRHLTFNFKKADWEDVIEWFLEEADLAANIDYYPLGTFSYQDNQEFTTKESLDLLNSVLLNKGWTIVRRGRLVMLLNLELGAEVPQELLELVPISELDQRGDFELVKSIFSLAKMSPEDAEGEIARLIGPGRTMIVLPKARQILVTETAGKLRVIRSVIEAIENPDSDRKKVIEVKLKHVLAETVLVTARPLLGLEPDVNTNDQINIATDAFGSRIFATGTEEAIEQLREIVVLMDIEHEESELAGPTLEAPDLRTYPISAADPATVNEVLQTLMAGLPDVRLAIDPLSNKLIAMARPSDHQLIVATLQKLEGDAPRFEVIQLRITEPDLMVMSINKLMGITEEGGPDGLQVDADITARRLLIRGTAAQIAQIQDLVVQLEGESGVYNDSPMRFIPMDSRQTDQLLGQVEASWPQVSKTKIRILAPADPDANNGVREIEITPSVEPIVPPTNPLVPPQPPRRERLEETSAPSMTRTAAEVSQFVFFPQQPETAGDASPSDVAPVVIQRDENAATGDSPIVIQRAPGGIWIYGEPKELNQLEELLNRLNMANGAGSGLVSQEIGVYYLRHTTAEVATQLLGDILGATSSSSSLIGDMAT
ncbi:MAG: hypothetical protein ABGX07_03410, partial [Pirellulaceae bacterium]